MLLPSCFQLINSLIVKGFTGLEVCVKLSLLVCKQLPILLNFGSMQLIQLLYLAYISRNFILVILIEISDFTFVLFCEGVNVLLVEELLI